MKNVLIFGTFDRLHTGHLYFLKQAKKYGNLSVVVARDKTVKEVKYKLPKQNEKQRQLAIKKTGLVKRVLLGNLKNKYSIIKKIKPDIICLGYDQKFFIHNLPIIIKKYKLKIEIIRLKPYKPHLYKTSIINK